MTLLQIEYTLVCAELGSISKAAKSLFTTTSNLSKMLGALEDELGFEIFKKGRRGLEVTQKGQRFLEHAAKISAEFHEIENMHPKKHSNRFSCACTHIPHCLNAFEQLCRIYQAGETMNFTLSVDYYPACVDKVIKRICELGIVSMPYLVDSIQREKLANHGMHIEHLATQTLSINLRRGHPVLKHYTEGEPFDYSLLQDYPYVSYSNPADKAWSELDFSQQAYFSIGAVNPQKCIYVDSIEWKARLVGKTDAFSIGITGPEELAEQNNWFCIPLTNYESNMYCIYPEDSVFSPEAKLYLEILREILSSSAI